MAGPTRPSPCPFYSVAPLGARLPGWIEGPLPRCLRLLRERVLFGPWTEEEQGHRAYLERQLEALRGR